MHVFAAGVDRNLSVLTISLPTNSAHKVRQFFVIEVDVTVLGNNLLLRITSLGRHRIILELVHVLDELRKRELGEIFIAISRQHVLEFGRRLACPQ